jgi:hypothetical protein
VQITFKNSILGRVAGVDHVLKRDNYFQENSFISENWILKTVFNGAHYFIYPPVFQKLQLNVNSI